MKLKPCPFCEGEAVIEQMGTPRVSMIYHCTECSCRLETGETFMHKDCRWNDRYPKKTKDIDWKKATEAIEETFEKHKEAMEEFLNS